MSKRPGQHRMAPESSARQVEGVRQGLRQCRHGPPRQFGLVGSDTGSKGHNLSTGLLGLGETDLSGQCFDFQVIFLKFRTFS